MRARVGYSENPDTFNAGVEAAKTALAQDAPTAPCDVAFLFSTSRHEPGLLRDAVASVVGDNAKIVGGGAIGSITNDHYGYAGDQVGLALV
jgi:hypothetical protein